VASKKIKELQKIQKNQETASEVKLLHTETKLEELIMAPRSQRKEALEGLVIRPNLTGKKTIGNLEI